MAKSQTGANPSEVEPTLPTVLAKPWTFLHPTDHLHAQVADSAKQILDPLAASIVDDQTLRRQINKKRKRVDAELDGVPPLQLKNLYVEGFTSNQIWEQATRILESAGREVERDITLLTRNDDDLSSADEDQTDVSDPEGSASESDDADSLSDAFSENASLDDDDDDDNEMSEKLEQSEEELPDSDSIMNDAMSVDEGSVDSDEEDPGTYVEDRFGLNDGFFSIDDFNKQTEHWERLDARGAGNDADDSDDEEIDWHANPMEAGSMESLAKPSASKKTSGLDENDGMDDDSEEDGPTFGNADLHGDSDSDEDAFDAEEAGMGGIENANDIKYADFFAPPPRKASLKKRRALPKTQPSAEAMEGDVERAMADVRRDLFDEESEAGGEDEDMDETGDSNGPRSTHEKQRARIADEIRRLEAANVAKKEWMLVGEARAVERPVNSLIEEDLDFERVGKPVPVVTNETTEDIEELVKRRILAKEFDEVIRRRPGAADIQSSRRGRFELADTKPQQSLAEMYEADHLRATDANFVDPKNQKLMREHAEVTDLWKEISSKLDLLCNLNYKPQTPQVSINVVTDAPTIMMEDARPTAGSAVGGPSALAPQEIYAPGDDGRVAGEVVLKTGAAISKDEMSREEKARKRRQKKSQKKEDVSTKPSGKAAEKQQLVSDLKKGGVKVINKEGKVTDMSGSKVQANTKSSGDTLKL
ncbi:U3 small nucleolar ribonucleoprotein Mpp10 [Penicillium brasilianum]|uniref:U3 small nucleolar ribonucleoprotein protein MPP10 n=1 Tax=Penicillium brasilianum TaxID=104259 RepID=A0A1S9RMT8_PENBI|nr:U3 small nucleolar ribonucleoprotein Mpp10 [Penicillium brasilianum]